MIRAVITGTGSYVPEKIMTNDDLAKIVETSDEWITTRSGIKERRIAAPDQATSDLAVQAGKKAIADAGLDAAELDLIVLATYTPDTLMPSTASYVQKQLGATKAAAFDISAACSGFVYALSVAEKFIITETYKNILVIGAETCSKFLDWTDRTTCVLFGDGAGAVVLQGKENSQRGILSTYLKADGAGADKLGIPAGGSRLPLTQEVLDNRKQFIYMSGQDVFKFSLRVIDDALTTGIEKSGLTLDQIKTIVPHQANVRIIDSAFKRLGIPFEKAYLNLQKYGNTSAASIPIALDEAVKDGSIKQGDNIILVGFGAGFTWASAVVTF